jgi:Spy/CpxP family protein refolding chaperone
MSFLMTRLLLLSGAVALAQQVSTPPAPTQAQIDRDVELLRKDVRSQKKQIVATNLNLTDPEAEKFWPVYDQYTNDLAQINNQKYALLKQMDQTDTLSSDQIDAQIKGWLQVDHDVAQLRLKYIPQFRAVLSPAKTARFYQIERRVQMLIDLQLASAIPLAGG